MNRISVVILMAIAGLSACTSLQQTLFTKTVVDGQLFCAQATANGPLVVALANASGVPVTVTGKASSVVAQACAVIGAIPVSPPANPSNAPVVSVNVAS